MDDRKIVRNKQANKLRKTTPVTAVFLPGMDCSPGGKKYSKKQTSKQTNQLIKTTPITTAFLPGRDCCHGGKKDSKKQTRKQTNKQTN